MAERPTQSEAEEHNQRGADSGRRGRTTEGEKGGFLDRVNRRSYLKAGAATAVGTVGLSTNVAAETRDGISFNGVVDAVDDLGMDPNGNEPIDDKLDRAWGSGTLIEFPAGQYLVTRSHNWYNDSNIGMVGATGDRSDVEFVFPEGYNDRFLNVRKGRNWLFGDFTVQQTNDNVTGVSCSFGPNDNATIQNLEIAGYNPRSKQRGMGFIVYDADGEATIDNYVRTGESAVGDYPTGTQALLVPSQHVGTLTIRDAHIENAGENGIYASRCPGDVRIEGGYFANNDIASVRIAGEGSSVRGATFLVDTDNTNNTGDYFNAGGLWIESGSRGYLGGFVEDCDFIMESANNSRGLLRVQTTAGNVSIRNCRFRNETRWGTIVAESPSRVSGSAPIQVENCSITGGSSSPTKGGIDITGRDGSEVSECCISMEGQQNGVVIEGANNCTVRRSTIDVNGQAIATPGSSVATSGISHSGSCPLPSDSGTGSGGSNGTDSDTSSSDETDSEDTTTEESSDEGGSSAGTSGGSGSDGGSSGSSEEMRTILLRSPDLSPYAFEVSGDLEIDAAYGTEDSVEGSTARGLVAGGGDRFRFTGEITSFTIEGSPTVVVDGEEVDPSSLGDGSSSSEAEASSDEDAGDSATDGDGTHTLLIRGDTFSPYEFTVSGDVSFNPAWGTDDRIDGSTVRGLLAGGGDAYEFTGEITSFTIEGSPEVLIDGDRVDPAKLESTSVDSSGSSDSTESAEQSADELSNHVLIRSDQFAPYELEVDGDIAIDPDWGTEDSVDGSTATGMLSGGGDAFRFSGTITRFDYEDEVTVDLNGESVSPDDLVGRGD